MSNIDALIKLFPPGALRQPADPVAQEVRRILMTERQTALMRLGAIEDALGLSRSRAPKHQRPASERSTPDAKPDR